MSNKNRINKAREELVAYGIIARGEDIYTKNTWRKMGYKVGKAEMPITTVPLYIYAPHKVYDKNGKYVKKSKMLFVRANFYKASQVTEMQKGA